jgi:hypothetical protein
MLRKEYEHDVKILHAEHGGNWMLHAFQKMPERNTDQTPAQGNRCWLQAWMIIAP